MRLFKSKRALQLSINFIVMLILAVVIFGFGLYFASTLFGKGGNISEQAFDKFDQQIEDLTCSSASKVCVPVQTKEAIGGNPVIFAVIIENVIENADFIISVEPSSYVNNLGERDPAMSPEIISQSFIYKPGQFNPADCSGEFRKVPIKYREKRNLGVAIQPNGAPAGTYAFTVKIYYGVGQEHETEGGCGYGGKGVDLYDTQKVYVKVPQ